MKKIMIMLLVLLFMLVFLVGCNTEDPEVSEEVSQEDSDNGEASEESYITY
ncbi:hypothetical protein [Isachenkonia alkalipeptolytica]|uniref:hypothetical protein n=1 Tax=Isachenkonia alkalipeptolytica TaxID=2565777 RepID=UPI0013705C9A|nr:hypothetical protein [Isachenkonia alkalipeptolytica]